MTLGEISNRQRLNAWHAMGLTCWVPLDSDFGSQFLSNESEGCASASIGSSTVPNSVNPPLDIHGVSEPIVSKSEDSSVDTRPNHRRFAVMKTSLLEEAPMASPSGLTVPKNQHTAEDVLSVGRTMSENVHFAAVWGLISSRKLAFWADIGESGAPGLSSAEANLLWRIMAAIGVDRSDVSQSQAVRWPFSSIDGNWRPELGDAGDMLTAFFGRYLQPEMPVLGVLSFGDTLSRVPALQRLLHFSSWADANGVDSLAYHDPSDDRKSYVMTLPSLSEMLNCSKQKTIAWNVLKKLKKD